MTGTGTLRWFRSSYSDSGGADCVEVAYDWHKSTYSSDSGGECVEMATCPHATTIHIRDSKNPGRPHRHRRPRRLAPLLATLRAEM